MCVQAILCTCAFQVIRDVFINGRNSADIRCVFRSAYQIEEYVVSDKASLVYFARNNSVK